MTERLLIRLGSMGDVVLATAAANALRDMWGDQCVDVLVKEAWAPLWRNHPAVRQIHAWRKRPLELYRWARRLRQIEYAEIIDLQASPRTQALLRLSRQHRSVRRPKRYTVRRRLLVRWHRFGPPRDYRVLDAFVAASGSRAPANPSLHPGVEARAKAARLVPSSRALIGLAPGARHETKRWPIQRYIALGRELVAQGNRPLPVFFGPDEDGLHAQWRVHWPGDGTWVPIREDLEIAAASLGRLRGLVSNDTGLMHMAAAMHTPVIAFFGPTVREFGFAPAGPSHRILEVDGLACRPCTIHGGSRCPKGHFRCMLDLDVATVLQHAEELRGDVLGPPAAERGRA
ncbi:MAG TPA: glycosyltransferase family 9 protein [Candidatus Eisenbacteria bacterium]|nr:glycosyltransferase family 9 protein [Candidatus Eisenbacteria bacterium]